MLNENEYPQFKSQIVESMAIVFINNPKITIINRDIAIRLDSYHTQKINLFKRTVEEQIMMAGFRENSLLEESVRHEDNYVRLLLMKRLKKASL